MLAIGTRVRTKYGSHPQIDPKITSVTGTITSTNPSDDPDRTLAYELRLDMDSKGTRWFYADEVEAL